MKRIWLSRLIPFLTGSLLVFLFTISVYYFYYQAQIDRYVLITEHVEQLQKIFTDIEHTCGIVDFAHEKSFIDFLTVEKFVGPEVGALRLRHPEKWHGPYVRETLTIQNKPYQVLKTYKGYYIVPADGVSLGKHKIVGKDIILNSKTDIDALTYPGGLLVYKEKKMAVPLLSHANQQKLQTMVEDETED